MELVQNNARMFKSDAVKILLIFTYAILRTNFP